MSDETTKAKGEALEVVSDPPDATKTKEQNESVPAGDPPDDATNATNVMEELIKETEIRLEKRDVTDADMPILPQILKESNALQTLVLHTNRLTLADGAITSGLAASTSLQKFDAGDNQITDEGAILLGEAMKENKSLINLNLVGNEIGDDGVKAIAAALALESSTLQEINLCENLVCNLGAARLGDSIVNNSALLILDVSCNLIGDTGAEIIAIALRRNKTLRELNLACNEIGDEGAENMSSALTKNQGLRKLWMTNNKIDDKGANKLVEGLKLNYTLKDFWFHGNPLSTKSYMKLIRVLEDRKSGKIRRPPPS